MNAWFALTKKEFQLNFPAFLIAVILFSGFFIGGFFLGNYIVYQDEVLAAVSIVAVSLHMFLLAFYLLYSLNVERRRLHLWLHTPMSVAGLLSAKIFTSIIFMAVTFFIFLTLAIQFSSNVIDIFNQQTVFNLIGTVTAAVFFSGLFIGMVVLLFWSIFLTFSQKMNDFLSFILTFILFLIASSAYGYLMELSFMETLTNWGAIQVNDIIVGFEFDIDLTGGSVQSGSISEASILYIGNFVHEIIGAVILFFTACWIIEKKVEV